MLKEVKGFQQDLDIEHSIKNLPTVSKLNFITGVLKTTYHAAVYLSRRLTRKTRAFVEKDLQMLAEISDLMYHYPPDGTYRLVVSLDDLKRDITSRSNRLLALRSRLELLMVPLRDLHLPDSTPELLEQTLVQLISEISTKLDKDLKVVWDDFRSYLVRALMFDKSFALVNVVEDIASDCAAMSPELFCNELRSLVFTFTDHLDIADETQIETAFSVIHRIMFDEIYPSYPFLSHPVEDVIHRLSTVTLMSLSIPKHFLGSPKGTLRDTFRTDPLYSKAVELLETVQFFHNPYDILCIIYKAIKEIEAGAVARTDGNVRVFPFELIFELFFSCVLSCDLPSFLQIAEFVELYVLREDISHGLEYARAITSATSLRFKQLLQ